MLEIVSYPHEVLKQKASKVESFDDELKRLISDMAEAMYTSRGVGLAAPQVNLSRRVLLIDPSGGDDSNQLVAVINPEVFWRSDVMEVGPEGCLSLPGVTLQVPRHASVNIEYHDIMGNVQRMAAHGFRARVLQHEIDHLDGVTMLDRVGRVARKLAMKGLGKNK